MKKAARPLVSGRPTAHIIQHKTFDTSDGLDPDVLATTTVGRKTDCILTGGHRLESPSSSVETTIIIVPGVCAGCQSVFEGIMP